MPATVMVIVACAIAVGIVAAFGFLRHPNSPFGTRRFRAFFERRPKVARFFGVDLDANRTGGLLLATGAVVLVAAVALVTWIEQTVDAEAGLARFDGAVAEYGLESGDASIFDVFRFFTHFGGTEVVVAVTIIVAAWGWWRHRNPQVAWFMGLVVAGQAVVNSGLKWLIDRDRPDLNQLADWSGSSFPSGHSAAAAATWAAVAVVLTLRSGRAARVFAAMAASAIAVGVAATRALLGVHWFTDVVAGLTVGFGWFLLCLVVFGGRLMRFGEAHEEAADATIEPHRERNAS